MALYLFAIYVFVDCKDCCVYSCFSAGNFLHVYAHIHTQHCGHNCKIREMNLVTQRALLSWGEPASLLWLPWAAPVQTVSGASVVTAAKTVIAWRCHNTGTCMKKQWLQRDFGLFSQSWRLFWSIRVFRWVWTIGGRICVLVSSQHQGVGGQSIRQAVWGMKVMLFLQKCVQRGCGLGKVVVC